MNKMNDKTLVTVTSKSDSDFKLNLLVTEKQLDLLYFLEGNDFFYIEENKNFRITDLT